MTDAANPEYSDQPKDVHEPVAGLKKKRFQLQSRLGRSDRTPLAIWFWELDRVLLGLILTLTAIGLIAVAAASPVSALKHSTDAVTLDPLYYFYRQLGWVIAGVPIMLVVSMLPKEQARRFAIIAAAAAFVLLFLIPVLGKSVNGAQRWIGYGFATIQPGEFLKPFYAVTLAWLLSLRIKDPSLPVVSLSFVLTGIVALLLMIQPNLGQTIIFCGIWFTLMMISGLSARLIAAISVGGAGGLIGAYFLYPVARNKPEKVVKKLEKPLKKELGDKYNEKDYKPPYGPWEQRLCLVPDSDMFKAISAGKAEVVTDHIETVTTGGIKLKSGANLDADIIVTATGLRMAVAGKVAFEVDGMPIDFHNEFYYKGCMFSNIPNMAVVFGYLNASWTLKADIVSEYVCSLLNHMDATSTRIANPVLNEAVALEEETLFDFSSGYIKRGIPQLPRTSTTMPWKLTQDYLFEKKILTKDSIDDGVIQFYGPNSAAAEDRDAATMEAAE